ncbi:formylglycine-generating enzyme family protein [Shigella sonnei]|nr:formylglycine-generating enzyme family protein [Shigella sonnei]
MFSFKMTKMLVTYAFYNPVRLKSLARGHTINPGCNGSLSEECRAPGFDNGMHPVTNVEWPDTVVFANALSELTGLTLG